MKKSTILLLAAIFVTFGALRYFSPKYRCFRSGGEWVETPRERLFPKLECRKKL